VVAKGGGQRWWPRVVAKGGGQGWWPRVVAKGDGQGSAGETIASRQVLRQTAYNTMQLKVCQLVY